MIDLIIAHAFGVAMGLGSLVMVFAIIISIWDYRHKK